MMAARLLRWIVLLALFIASVTWSYIAITHLLDSSMNQQQRTSQYQPTSRPAAGYVQKMEDAQARWGRQSLFAVAGAFFMLLVVLMNWVLDGRSQRPLRR